MTLLVLLAAQDLSDAEPLPTLEFEIRGAAPDPDADDRTVRFSGTVLDRSELEGDMRRCRENIRIQTDDGVVTVHWGIPGRLDIDLRAGQEVEVEWRQRIGFEGQATGLRIRDADGWILIGDDGQYGNAWEAVELEPFAVSQEDAGFRNRENTPGSLNNFWLVVAAGEERVRLIHGQSGNLDVDGRTYTVLAAESTSRVDDVVWTDAPYEYRAFVIARRPQ